MTNLNLASAKELKELVSSGAVTHVDALKRVYVVLNRGTLAAGKRARWTRLEAWLLNTSPVL